jgi:hypothetical protein
MFILEERSGSKVRDRAVSRERTVLSKTNWPIGKIACKIRNFIDSSNPLP